MGEIADMMIEGILCQRCGVLMEDMTKPGAQPPGYPRDCPDCARDDEEPKDARDLLECRRLDPNSRLAAPGAAELLYGHEITEDQIDAINEAIEAWAQRDPMGYSEHESRRLERRIAEILEE